MSLSVKSHSYRFLEYLEQKNPEAAYTRAEACLLQSEVDQEELYQICTHLDTLLNQISPEQAETLLLHLLKALQEFPVFAEEQAHTLTRYGEIYLSKGDSLSAMRCFATAHLRNPSHESAQRLLSPLFPSILEGLETQLQRATGLGDPALFQQLLTQFTHKFGTDTPSVQQIYQVAERVYKGIQNPNTKMLFIDLLDEIEAGMDGRSPPRANPLPYLQHLQQVREGFEDQTTTRQYQKERAEAFCGFFQKLFQDALFILGEPPCNYDIRAMGSLAREEVCPYSDLEHFILIEEEQHLSYFQKLAKIFDLQILSLGETDPKHQELFNFGQKFGLEIDHQANPAYNDALIGRPEQLFALPQEPSPDDLKAYKSRLRSVSLQRNHEFTLPHPTLDVRVLLEMRKEEFASLNPLQSTIYEVKREFVEPLFHLISDLGLYFGLEERNTLDLIEKLPLFTQISKRLLKTAVSDLYRLRVRLHLARGGIQEEASLVPSLELTTLTDQEKESLKQVYELVLTPLYQMDLDARDVDFVAMALQQPNETNVALAAQFVEEDHPRYYTMLSSPDHVALQRIYLNQVPDHIESFTPTLPFTEGTIVTLSTQFHLLQSALKEKTYEHPPELLQKLIHFQRSGSSPEDPLVEEQYKKALQLPFNRRLSGATGRPDQSLTSAQPMELQFSERPTFEQIQPGGKYSLKQAYAELCLLEAHKLWASHIEGDSISVDFSAIQDPEREKLMLKSLAFLLESKTQKPTSISLRHTQTLTPDMLNPLLHPGLLFLDLSYGALVSEGGLFTASTLSQIETFSSNLERLELEGCPSLVQPTITLPQLRRLNISCCSNLKSLNLQIAQLQELKINHSPRLKTVMVSITPETEVDWKETPGLAISQLAEQWYQLGKRYVQGDGVYRDPEKALALWEKAAAGGHIHAQEILKWNELFNKIPASLDLRWIQIGEQGAAALARALKVNSNLTSLRLSQNQIGEQGATALAEALKVNQTITSLDL